MKNKGCSLRDL